MKEIITLDMYLKGQSVSDELLANAKDLLLKVNSLLQDLRIKTAIVASGYRSPEHNASVGGKPKSNHMTCQAIDIQDAEGTLAHIILQNLYQLQRRGMAMEDLNSTPTWVHLQSVLPRSGKTIFLP